jgi:hypothetical protein
MGTLDKRPRAIPLNTFKQDYNLISLVGGRGGGGLPETGCSRFTFWVDYDPFDVQNRFLVTQNAAFEIWSDEYGTYPIYPHVIIGQSDDIPDEQVIVGETSTGDSVGYPGIMAPYYLNTKFTSQPANASFQNDQGRYTGAGYQGSGSGFGSVNMLGQAFVPKQSQLTGFFFQELFHTNTTDPTTFVSVKFELWDANHNFYAHLGTLQPTFNATTGSAPTGLITDSSCTAYCNDISYDTATDGKNYWITLDLLGIELASGIAVTPGATYYIMVRATTLTSSDYYFLGNNVDGNSGLYSGKGRYTAYDQLGVSVNAHGVLAADGSSTFYNLVDANSHNIDFPFITQGNVGRTAITFWWADQSSPTTLYWNGVPTGYLSNQFKFIHLDFDQRV